MSGARILQRTETRLSPWVTLVSKDVELGPGQRAETYHCLSQADYIAILAQTQGGLIPLIRQYRAAVEAYTWELPAGLLEHGEQPEDACRRELREETGLQAESITSLGSYYPDPGRLENRTYAFLVRTPDPDPTFAPEPGLSVEFVTAAALREHIRSGKFLHQPHLGVLTAAYLAGFDLGR